MLVSIITPAHNEAKIIKNFIAKAANFLKRKKIDGEIIVVENGSTDNTWEIIKKNPSVKAMHLSRGNKGQALKAGMKAAQGEFLITLDTDLWDEKFVDQSLINLKNFDIVVGSKSLSGSKDERVLSSKIMNWGYNFLFRLVFNLRGTDTHAKLSFNRAKILPLVAACQTEDLNFDTELIIRSERAALSKLEIPTQVKEIRPRVFSLRTQLVKTVKNFLTLIKVLGPSPNWNYIFIFLGLSIGAILRFTYFKDWFFFSVDEEHYSFMTRMITVDHHIPLIGGPISGTSLYMAPWFLYANAVLFFLSNNNPLFNGMVFALIELSTVLLIYLIGKKLFSGKAGALAALLYGSSFLMALFDRHYWNITLTPFLSAATFYCLLRYLEGGKKWLILTALIVGFGISSTFSLFAVFLFAVIVIALFKRPVFKGDIFLFLTVIGVLHIPLVLFDLRHNFWLLNGLIEFLTVHSYDRVPFLTRAGGTLVLFLETLGKSLVITSPLDVSDEISICTERILRYHPQLWAMAITAAGLFGYLLIALRSKRKTVWLIGLLWLVNFSSLFLFRADPAERHWLPFLPLFFLTLGATLASFPGKILAFVIISPLVILNLMSYVHSYASYGLADKETAVKIAITKTSSAHFSVNAVGDCHKWGYRYLFSQFNHEPGESYLDGSFSWMYSAPPNPKEIETHVTFFAPNKHFPLTPEESQAKQKLLDKAESIISSGSLLIFIEN